jgi:hypothetical protein
LKKGTFFFSGHLFAVFLKPEKMDVPFFNGLLGGVMPEARHPGRWAAAAGGPAGADHANRIIDGEELGV